MKKITLFLLTLIISCSAWGATPEKLYLTPNSNWKVDNARFAAYFFGNGDKWVSMTAVEGETDLYEVTVPAGYPNVIFCRMNPGNATNSWDTKWNQTSDLAIPTNGTNHYTVTEGAWDKGGGTWTTYAPGAPVTYTDITITVVANAHPKIHYWDGGDKVTNTNWDERPLMNPGDNNTYSYTIKDVDEAIGLNYIITIDDIQTPDLYTTTNVTANFKDLLPQVVVMGVNNWDGTDKMTVSDDYKTATITLNLTAKAYEWKLTVNGEWFGDNYTITRNNNYATMDANGSNCTLKADKTGNYIFTYTYSTKKLVVTYPKLTVTVKTNNSEWGTVTGGGDFDYNAETTITAIPNNGYKFVKWNDENTNNPRTIKVTKDATYTATFEKLPKDVTFSDPSTLTIGETYDKLSYKLTMPDNDWYWIVLPYNVNVSEITTSTGGGWNDLVFTEYDAQRRAEGKNGWINWKTYKDNGEAVPTQLQANKGYVIGPKDGPFNQDGDFVVTFPSASPTNIVDGEAELTTTEAIGSNEKDNNWHIVGTGLYHPTSALDGVNYIAVPDNKGDYTYYYVNAPATDIFDTEFTNYTFNPFEAFFVQYGGTYSATATVATTSAELAPVARAKAQEQEQIYLINMNEAHTVVILNAEGSEGYTAGEDFLEMNVGSRIEMIYSFDAEDALAFNHRATEAQSIALGGYVATAGEQTISLDAYNGNAEAVTLIDNVTGTTTDLLAEDYTFTAEVGSLDGRFTIVFAAQKAGSDTTVDCYNSIANQVIAYGTADHCTVSGLTAGEAIVVYNTMGQLVFATTADSETITLPSLTAGNYLILHNGTTNKVTLR